MTDYQAALDGIEGDSWADDLARASVRAAWSKFSPETYPAGPSSMLVRVRADSLDGGWVADCPAGYPGAHGQGDSAVEALRDLADAIESADALREEQARERRAS